MSLSRGKLTSKDEAVAKALRVAPFLALLLSSLPAPVFFLILFLTANATDSAAVYLLLSALTLAFGFAAGLLFALFLIIYKRRWLSRLRDRLAADGITANEVVWFRSELTSAEKASLAEIERSNPLLADAYQETLAARLSASRIIAKARRELLKVERRANRVRTLNAPDTTSLLEEFASDRKDLERIGQNAGDHLVKAKARLQMIEAAVSRSIDQADADLMMRRLNAAQDYLPLVLEMDQLEKQALKEAEHEIDDADLHHRPDSESSYEN
jgi:hypothetical protein